LSPGVLAEAVSPGVFADAVSPGVLAEVVLLGVLADAASPGVLVLATSPGVSAEAAAGAAFVVPGAVAVGVAGCGSLRFGAAYAAVPSPMVEMAATDPTTAHLRVADMVIPFFVELIAPVDPVCGLDPAFGQYESCPGCLLPAGVLHAVRPGGK